MCGMHYIEYRTFYKFIEYANTVYNAPNIHNYIIVSLHFESIYLPHCIEHRPSDSKIGILSKADGQFSPMRQKGKKSLHVASSNHLC